MTVALGLKGGFSGMMTLLGRGGEALRQSGFLFRQKDCLVSFKIKEVRLYKLSTATAYAYICSNEEAY